MDREIRPTGGNKEFHYAQEDMRGLGSEDTHYSRKLKNHYSRWRDSLKYSISKFFRSSYLSYNYKPIIKNLLILCILGTLIAIIYPNLEKLNEITLFFIKFGSAIFISILFFFLR